MISRILPKRSKNQDRVVLSWRRFFAPVAAHEATVAHYRQAVLNAFIEVGGALRAVEHSAETLEAQRRDLALRAKALLLPNFVFVKAPWVTSTSWWRASTISEHL